MRKIAIIHPWMPTYRITFFQRLTLALAKENITVDIFFGEPENAWKLRNDQGYLDGSVYLPTKQIKIGGRTLLHKSLKSISDLPTYDLVIAEHAIRNLETFQLIARRTPLAFWGHGRTYTQVTNVFIEALKGLLARKARWFFAYTNSGAVAVAAAGLSSEKITVLNNTIDIYSLKLQLEQISDGDVANFRRVQLKDASKVALFLGALDKSKKIEFLFDSLDIVAKNDPNFRFLIVGDGPLRGIVARLVASRPWAFQFGSQFGAKKALMLKAADSLVIPGRAGLVVVDSFAAERPIVTTTDEFHPPEFEYLKTDFNAIVVGENVSGYAKAIEDSFDPEVSNRLKAGCRESSTEYSLDKMVSNFAQGVLGALSRPPK
jgi:glycosyltransferase involved in cell wall biosynthesis